MSLTISTEYLERVTIECPMEEVKRAIEYAYQNGFHMREAGPKSIGFMRCDKSVYQWCGEKVVERFPH